MNEKNIELRSDSDIMSFLEDYCEFGINRAYILSVMARPKENNAITYNNIPMFREIITNKSNLKNKYNQLKSMANNYTVQENTMDEDLTFRLYITANARDIDTAFYIYQKELLEMRRHAQNGHDASKEKMKRLDKEWKSILQKDTTKDDSKFIIDIDAKDAFKEVYNILEDKTDIIKCISTPNGYHIITEPFEYPKHKSLDEEYIEVKTDGLLFISLL